MPKSKKGRDYLDIIQSSKNVREACKALGISRSQYYKLLKDPEPASPKPYEPLKMGEEAVQRILDLALLFPFGCHGISYKLQEEGIRVSSVSVQKILNAHKLGTAQARYKALEKKIIETSEYVLNGEQKEFLSKHNPVLLEGYRKIQIPGDLITVFSFFLGQLPWLGKVYLYFSLDAYSGYIQAMVAYTPDKYLCAEFLKKDIFPFYEQQGISIRQVETSDDPEFFSFAAHPFSSFLRNLNGVIYNRTTVGGVKTNGFSQKWHQYLKGYIVPELKSRKADYQDLELLNENLQRLIAQYNQGSNPETVIYFDSYPFDQKNPIQRLTNPN
jgi:transposase